MRDSASCFASTLARLLLVGASVTAGAVGCGNGPGSIGDDDVPGEDGGPDQPDASPGGPDAGPATPDASPDAAPIVPLQLSVCPATAGSLATIGEAITAATPGSTISVCAGTYHERLLIEGKDLILIGTGGAGTTILDGDGAGTVVTVGGSAGVGVSLTGFTIRNGLSLAEGGGVRCDDSTLAIIDSTITANRATLGGGGLYAHGCTLVVRNTQVDFNSGGTGATSDGGGLLLDASSGVIENSRILFNSVSQVGGGIRSIEGDVGIVGNEIRANTAHRGAGIYHSSSARIGGNRILDNVAGWTGGGIHIDLHAPMLMANTVGGNRSANDGGGIYVFQSQATLVGNDVIENDSADDGGGIRIFESMATLMDNRVERNHANDGGGGIRVSHVPSLLVNNIVRDNVAGGTGGGMDLDNDGSLVRGGIISGNRAGGSGGGVFAWLGIFDGHRFEDVEISSNRAWQGAGMYVVNNFAPVSLKKVRFIGNRGAKGGGLMIRSTNFTITNSLFRNNNASERGGAIFAGANPEWRPEGMPVGTCPCPPAMPTGQVNFTVMSGNTSPRGAALWTSFPGLSVENSIVTTAMGMAIEAAADEDAADPDPEMPPPPVAVPAIRYSNVFPATFVGMMAPTGTDGNIAADPAFVDAVNGDFHLAPGSPSIDTGSPALIDTDGTRADMGMFGGAL